MDFKLVLLLSVACFAVFIQPAQSGNIVTTAIDAVRDMASIGRKVVQTEGAAVVRGSTDIGSILATALGLKIRALAQASAAAEEGIGDGFLGVGDLIKNVGNNLVGDKLAGTSAASSAVPSISFGRLLVEAPVVQDVVEKVKVKTPAVVEDVAVPYEQEVVSVPVQSSALRSVQLRVRRPEEVVEASARIPIIGGRLPSVFTLLKNAARSKVNGVTSIFNIGGSRRVGAPFVYEIVETPRVYQRPVVEAFQIQKK